VAVLNADDPRGGRHGARDARAVVTYGRAGTAHVRASASRWTTSAASRFTLESRRPAHDVTLGVRRPSQRDNALAAAAAGVALGMPLADVARGLQRARPVAGRCVWRRPATCRSSTTPTTPARSPCARRSTPAAAHRRGRA
jgi:UDP-N-acetylmuramoyl-tripeptide--D-alanyl-D-alanine ligase